MSSAQSVSEIVGGPAKFYWGPSGSEIQLGFSENGAELTIENRWVDILTDEHGDGVVKRIGRGQVVTLEIILKQFDNAQLLIAMVGSSESTGPTRKALQYGRQAGIDGNNATYGKRARVHPMANLDANEADDLFIYITNVIGTFKTRWTSGGEKQIGVLLGAVIDTSKADGNLLGRWGTDAS